jgi:hypothetical protein
MKTTGVGLINATAIKATDNNPAWTCKRLKRQQTEENAAKDRNPPIQKGN